MKEKPEAKQRIINGNTLECPVCKNDTFWMRKTLMNTRGMTFFNVEWVNKESQNYVCDSCGYVYWFIQP